MRIINRNWVDFPLGLRQARIARGMTQSGLAEAMDVDQATVSRWERGTQVPEPDLQARLREFLFRGRAVQDAMIFHFVRSSPGLRALISSGGIFLACSQVCGGKRLEGRQISDFRTSTLRSAWSLACDAGMFRGGLASVRFVSDIRREDGTVFYVDCVWYPVAMTDGSSTLLADMVTISEDQYGGMQNEGVIVTPLESILTPAQ